MTSWHSLAQDDLFGTLNTTKQGLDTTMADMNLRKYGYNQLEVKSGSFWKKVIEPFRSIFILILLAAAAVSFATNEPLDGTVIAVIIAINAVVYYTQQYATTRVLRSLKKHNEYFVQVLRDGKTVNLASKFLVPGDVILLTEGQKVPADARVLREDNLFMNESALTGESLPIKKHITTLKENEPLYAQSNMVFSGTYVASGAGSFLVVATGSLTQFGLIAKMAVQAESKSPMQIRIDSLVSRLIKLLGGVALVIFGLSLLRGIETGEALRFVMAMSVAAVPEDLPIALTVVAVLGMRRMAKKKALVRSMRTIEDLGLTTVIATDKTGTLTKNVLSVAEIWAPSANINLKTVGYSALGNADNSNEPFDQALKTYSSEAIDHSQTLIKSYPFNQAQRMSGAVWQEASNKVLYLKGAPEHLLQLCKLNNKNLRQAEDQLHQLVAKGFRVIAFATGRVSAAPKDLNSVKGTELDFMGLIAFADELRPESAAAIKAAQNAGITVKLITGDHFETAFHIGKILGLSTHRDQVITGNDLPESEAALRPLLKIKSVFARILPQQKFNILKTLKSSEVTAMTGDGVNDVPALTNAHVGIAMGSGNDIAKDAGDIVLLDDSFSSIVSAISEGRAIYDNIKRILFYLFSCSLGEILTMVGALLVGLPLPVTAIMILWVNLVTDTAIVIPLGLEPPEKDNMKQPPRRPEAPLLSRMIMWRIALVGMSIAVPTLLMFNYLLNAGYSLAYAQSVAFIMLVASQWINALNARSERFSVFARLKVMNLKLVAGLALAVLLQILVMFGPLKGVFGVVSINLSHLLIGTSFVMIAVLFASEIHKLFYKEVSN